MTTENTQINNKSVTNFPKESNLEYLLEMSEDNPDYNLRFEAAKDCKTEENCSEILNAFPTTRLMRISYLAGMGHNINYYDMGKLCQSCQSHIYNSYKEKIGTCAKEGLEMFLAEILESNTNEEYKASYSYLSKLLDDPNVSQEEIDTFLEHYEKLRRKWKQANTLFKELLNEAAARRMGYDVDLPKNEVRGYDVK